MEENYVNKTVSMKEIQKPSIVNVMNLFMM